MMFLLFACVGSKGPAADSIPTAETIDSGTDTDDTTTTDTDGTTPTDDTGTASAPCSADPLPVTDPDCPEGVAALIAGVPYTSVDEATAAATSGATVEVCPGRWLTNATITTALTLRGRAGLEATVLDGGGVGRVLTIDLSDYEGDVTVEGVTITGGETSEDGGGIYVERAWVYGVSLQKACVLSNHAGGNGGGMAGHLMRLTLGPDLRIQSNASDGNGGGVYSTYSNDQIFDATFRANTAGGCGGGYHGEDGKVFSGDVLFEGNVASDGGGAAYLAGQGAGGYARFQGVEFVDNVAAGWGGGLLMGEDGAYGPSGIFDEVSFRGNVADVGGGLGVSSTFGESPAIIAARFEANSARLGGAIGGVVAGLDRGFFLDNSATEAGGAVYAHYYAWGFGAVLEGNSAPVGGGIALDGGALWFIGDFGTGTAANVPDDVALLTSVASYGGLGAGAVASCADDGCRFAPPAASTSADTGDSGETAGTGGSGTAAPGCDATTAALVDGAPYATVGDAVTAATSGATVDVCPGDWPANLVLTGDLTLRGAGWDATALDGGGAGGVISVQPGASLVISDLTLHGGYAQVGGGMYVGGVVEANAVVAEGNVASGGGGVAVYGGDVTWTGGRITGNTALGRGGGIYMAGGSLSVIGSTIASNLAESGGGIFANGGLLTLEASPLEDNVAGISSGGGLEAYSLVARGVTAVGNYAGSSGGGIYCNACTLSDVVATGNTASHGGGVYLEGGALSGSAVAGNVALSAGGVYVSGGLVEDTEITANQAVSGGGALVSGDATLTRVTLSGNRAVDGGGLYLYDDTTLGDTTVTGNLADRGGGAWLELGVLTSLTSDWGTGADDNVPDDVASETSSEASYGAAASFSCDAATGVCE